MIVRADVVITLCRTQQQIPVTGTFDSVHDAERGAMRRLADGCFVADVRSEAFVRLFLDEPDGSTWEKRVGYRAVWGEPKREPSLDASWKRIVEPADDLAQVA